MNWKQAKIPPDVARIPAMLTDEERRYLSWVTAEAYEGWGAIVDLGPWLGGSSAALAEGLARRGSDAVVRSMDLFEWSPGYMERTYAAGLAADADFMPLFREFTEPYAAWIRPEKADLTKAHWDGGPIEILFVDAAKSWQLWNSILATFGPHLQPGRSRVIHQDFRHHGTYWLPLAMDGRPDLWREVEAVEEGTTVTFMPREALSALEALEPSEENDQAVVRILESRAANSRGNAREHYELALYSRAVFSGDRERIAECERRFIATSTGRTTEQCELARISVFWELVRRLSASIETGAGTTSQRLQSRLDGSFVEEWMDPSNRRAKKMLAQAHIGRAGTLLAERKFDATNASILEALQLAPDSPEVVRNACSLLEQAWTAEQDGERATRILADLERRFEGQPDVLVLRALLLRSGVGAGDARTLLESALAANPEHPDAGRLLSEWFPTPRDGGAQNTAKSS